MADLIIHYRNKINSSYPRHDGERFGMFPCLEDELSIPKIKVSRNTPGNMARGAAYFGA